jgi:hemerythrin
MALILSEAPAALARRPAAAQPTAPSDAASAATLAAQAAVPRRWPGSWPEREQLLERQHQILREQIAERILTLLAAGGGQESAAAAAAATASANQQLLRQLHLHLRLEERWLGACGCLCPGHRASHQQVARDTQAGLRQAGTDHRQQLIWLRALQAWLLEHCAGADARAYALAHSLADPQP